MVPPAAGARIVPRPLVSLSVRCALAAALALALGVAGCGRKGALDPPPGGLAEPTVIGAQPAPPPGPDGQVAAAAGAGAPPAPQPAPKKQTPLDWLLN
jgi:predicted small lipoprotein YifL